MAPELAPFMADELLLSMPEVEGIDYTMKEYMKLVDQTKQCVERLNAQGEDHPRHIHRYHSKTLLLLSYVVLCTTFWECKVILGMISIYL